jgi:hypothetical protein
VNLLQEYLIEQLLEESLDDAYGFYKDKLTREEFDKLIALDPTFNVEQDRLGTYGKWILTSFLRKTLKPDEFFNVEEVLGDFHERKRYITKPDGKDINTYKTLQDIRASLDTIELTDNQKEKLRRKAKKYADLGEEAEFLFEDDSWEIWIPKTYAASLKLGSESQWCTASTGGRGERYFHLYTDKWSSDGRGMEGECSDLYVFLHKKETNKKHQLQVISDENKKPIKIGDFMDINDRSVNFQEFLIQEKLANSLLSTALKTLEEVKGAAEIEKMFKKGFIKLVSCNGEESSYSYLPEDGGRIKNRFFLKNPDIKELILTGQRQRDMVEDLFYNTLFEKITFNPDSDITTIYSGSFKECPNLKEVVLPTKLVNIDKHAFKGSENLEVVFLPDTVRFIGYQAFEGCYKVQIRMNKRTGKNKIQVPAADLPFLKQHLVVTDGVTGEITESIELYEGYNPTMPSWLKGLLEGPTGSHIRNVLLSKESSNALSIPPIDIENAVFNTAPVPTSPRDKYLRSPYLPIYFLGWERDGKKHNSIYIPNYNGSDKAKWNWREERLGDLTITEILNYTKEFAYLDTREPNNFIDENLTYSRLKSKENVVKRLTPSQIEKSLDTWSFRKGEMRVDKSGYKIYSDTLIKKLNSYNRENFAKVLKKYHSRIEALRKALNKEMVSLDIKNERYDESSIREAHDTLFATIGAYREVLEFIENALREKDKKEKNARLNTIFSKEEGNQFENLRQKILRLERIIREVVSTTLESMNMMYFEDNSPEQRLDPPEPSEEYERLAEEAETIVNRIYRLHDKAESFFEELTVSQLEDIFYNAQELLDELYQLNDEGMIEDEYGHGLWMVEDIEAWLNEKQEQVNIEDK